MAAARGRVVYRSPQVVARFELNRAGIRKIAMGETLRDTVMDFAENRAKPYAVAISPVDSGDYVSSFEVQPATTVIAGLRRVVARLVNQSGHAAAVEYGNRHNPNGHAVLGRTIDFLHGVAVIDPLE